MAVITIRDLHTKRVLDSATMSSIKGAGAPWVYGWIRPFTTESPGLVPVINFYQVNNYADQMINQNQIVNVSNSAANANINVALSEDSANKK